MKNAIPGFFIAVALGSGLALLQPALAQTTVFSYDENQTLPVNHHVRPARQRPGLRWVRGEGTHRFGDEDNIEHSTLNTQ